MPDRYSRVNITDHCSSPGLHRTRQGLALTTPGLAALHRGSCTMFLGSPAAACQPGMAPWIADYNHHRPHSALGGGIPPTTRLNNVLGFNTQGALRGARCR
jgi:transposase InsO family protein